MAEDTDPHPYLTSRGFDELFIKEFGLVEKEGEGVKFPYPAEPDETQLYKYRWLKEDAKNKFSYRPKGLGKRLYDPRRYMNGTGEMVLCAGEFDTMIMLSLGFPAVGVPGEGSFKEEWAKPCRNHQKITIIFDGDDAGRKGAIKAAEKIGGEVFVARVPEGKDVNDLYLDGWNASDFAELIENSKDANAIPEPEPVGVLLSDVEPETVDWLWPGRIPLGKLTVLDGDPGLGKSTLTLDIAARLSLGHAMPDVGSPGIGVAGTVILTAEDGLGDTIRPRLDVAGADCTKILALQKVKDKDEDRTPVIPDDVGYIKTAIEQVDAKLLIIDPIMAFLSGETHSHQDQSIRRALHQLTDLAEETGVAVVVVRHLNKGGGGKAVYRGGGSIGIIGAARSGLLVGVDPDNESRRVLAPIKSNLGIAPKSLAFSQVNQDGVPRIEWGGESAHSANALLAEPDQEERGEGPAMTEAKNVLQIILKEGPVLVSEATKQAKAAGVAARTLRRARESLEVHTYREGFEDPWYWRLPPPSKEATPSEDGQDGQDGEKDPKNGGICAGRAKDDHGLSRLAQTEDNSAHLVQLDLDQTREPKSQVDSEVAQDVQGLGDRQDDDSLEGFEEVPT